MYVCGGFSKKADCVRLMPALLLWCELSGSTTTDKPPCIQHQSVLGGRVMHDLCFVNNETQACTEGVRMKNMDNKDRHTKIDR